MQWGGVVNYRLNNEKLASYINKNYSDSVLFLEKGAVRGYVNILFKRGVYEWRTYNDIKNIAKSNGQKYIISLSGVDTGNGVYRFNSATAYDTNDNVVEKISIDDKGNIISSK